MCGAGHRICALLIFFAVPLMVSVSHAAEQPNQHAESAVIERGKYLAIAADCGACHTTPGGKPYAGGLPISTPLGTIYSTNITRRRISGSDDIRRKSFRGRFIAEFAAT